MDDVHDAGYDDTAEPPRARRRRRAAGRPAGPPVVKSAEEVAQDTADEGRSESSDVPEPEPQPAEAESTAPAAADTDKPAKAARKRQADVPAISPTDPFHVGFDASPEVDDDGFDLDVAEAITSTAFFLAPEIDLEEVETEPAPPKTRQRNRKPRATQTDSGKGDSGKAESPASASSDGGDDQPSADTSAEDDDAQQTESASSKRRRRRRRRGSEDSDDSGSAKDEVTSVKGSTRLEAKRQRRREGRDAGRRRSPIVSEAEFLARRESVDRVMVVRGYEDRTQIAVLEDKILVEHYVTRDRNASMIGNVYLGKVQNVLPSMEAAFIDIGRGRNAVLYAGEVNWEGAGLEGQPKRIELALQSGDSVLVQVTKDPVGHKGARLTSQISLPGRYLVYVPNGRMTGISRKLPDKERSRLKKALRAALPEDAGVIVRTAAEGASEEQLASDVARLAATWESINAKTESAKAPSLLYSEPDLAIRVVRDIFNEDFAELIVSGTGVQDTLEEYVGWVAPELSDRIKRWTKNDDVFAEYRIDEQITKALDRKVLLPSGGSLVIDRTEAMTVVDVNTGRFVGSGGNLEETVTRNNLEAAEEIVRQLRLRDIGGIIVVDFIDMVLESNRDLVVRRLVECLGRDRTKHQVAEITSLGLVQMTRKRLGQGLLETFSEPCEHCNGRGVKVQNEPVGSRRRRPPGPIPGAPIKQEEAPAVASDADEPASAEIPDEVAVEPADEPADATA
ncbi:MAG: Rne/Rng family ribonuclease [Candidatus Nanopelagicales bacterium]